jgi:RNA polymerase sigma factor (sigma-70 family)
MLRQLAYSRENNREFLTLNAIKEKTLSKKHVNTLRKKLRLMTDLKLLDTKADRNLNGAYKYSLKKNLLKDKALYNQAAAIEAKDLLILGEDADYTLAEIINKFRMTLNSGTDTIEISCNEIIKWIHSDKTNESIRLRLKYLETAKYIKIREKRKGKRYTIQLLPKLSLEPKAHEISVKNAKTLLKLFELHMTTYHPAETINRRSWQETFVRMLSAGCNYADLKHIIAYLPADKHYLSIIKSPTYIRRLYADLVLKSAELPKRAAKRHIKKLLSGKITPGYLEVQGVSYSVAELLGNEPKPKEEPQQAEPAKEHWEKVAEWYESIKGALYPAYQKSSYGVDDVDYDDFCSEARLIMLDYVANPPKSDKSKTNRDGWLMKQLQGYMYDRRAVDKTRNLDERPVLRVQVEDFDNLLERVRDERDDCSDEAFNELNSTIKKALKGLSKEDRRIVSDYFGLGDSIKLTYQELADKYGRSKSFVHEVIDRSKTRLRRLLDPPGG